MAVHKINHAPSEGKLTIEDVEAYILSINLGNYDLDGVEITPDDFETVLKRVRNNGSTLEEVAHKYLLEVREVLDWGLEDEDDSLL